MLTALATFGVITKVGDILHWYLLLINLRWDLFEASVRAAARGSVSHAVDMFCRNVEYSSPSVSYLSIGTVSDPQRSALLLSLTSRPI